MAGTALETLLLAMVHMYGSEVEAAGLVPRVKQKPKPLVRWALADLLRAAAGMNWLPTGFQFGGEWKTYRAKIGDYAEALRQTRNLVHPARYRQDYSPSRVTRKYLVRSLEILESACKHLGAEVHASLRQDLGIDD